MKVIEDVEDRYGQPCMIFDTADIRKIHEWLYSHYNGFKFVIVLNVMGDEYEEHEKETYVYFMDCVIDEVAEYSGKKVIEK